MFCNIIHYNYKIKFLFQILLLTKLISLFFCYQTQKSTISNEIFIFKTIICQNINKDYWQISRCQFQYQIIINQDLQYYYTYRRTFPQLSPMSITSTPIPKLSRNLVSPLANVKTLGSGSTDYSGNNDRSSGQSPSQRNHQSDKMSPYSSELAQKSRQKSNSSDKSHPKGNILHISNICPKMTYEQIKKGLYQLFSIHGPIYEIVIKTKDSGQHFAFVDFPDVNHAESAWLASRNNAKKLDGRPLMVNYCQDPSKNMDRKSSKCFLCHGTGHKAVRCPVKPEMIKPKPKRIEEAWSQQDDTNYAENPQNSNRSPKLTPQKHSDKRDKSEKREKFEKNKKYDEQSDRSSSASQEKERDKDYLRFLKLKKKLLEQKLRKKVKKQKKKKN